MAPRNKTAGKGAGQSGRSHNRGVPKSGSNASSDKTKQSLDDLSDIVFDVGDNRTADGYITAKKRLVEYVSSTFDQGAEIGISIETGTLCVIPIPADPVTPIITPAVSAVPAIAAVPARAAVPFIAAVAADPDNGILAQPAIQAVPAQAAIPAVAAVPAVPAVHAPIDARLLCA